MSTDSLGLILQQGFEAHKNGDFSNAQQCYLLLLKAQPAQTQVLYLLGTLCCQTGDYQQGHAYLQQVIALEPSHAEAHANLGNVFNNLKQYDEALAHYKKATALKPDYIDAYFNQGILLSRLKRFSDAKASFEEITYLNPNHAMAYFHKAKAELELGLFSQAAISLDKTIGLMPNLTDAYKLKSLAQQKLAPSDSNVAQPIPDFSLKTAAELIAYGENLEKLNLYHVAIAFYQAVVTAYPENSKALNQLAKLLHKFNRLEEALECYTNAIRLDESNQLLRRLRVAVYQLLNRPNDVLMEAENIYRLDKDDYHYYMNRGGAFLKLLRHDAALECFTLASQSGAQGLTEIDLAYPNLYAGIIWLSKGYFTLGWRLYEARWQCYSAANLRNFAEPLWLNNFDIAGRHILIHAEQGLGDTLNFLRYVELVVELGAKVTFEVQPPLLSLIKNHTDKFEVLAKGQPLPIFDAHCPLMSLPLAFNTTLDSIPPLKQRLIADTNKVDEFKKRIQPLAAVKPNAINLGFVFSGRPEHKDDISRSIPLAQFSRCLPAGFNLFCLQKEIRNSDQAYLSQHRHIHCFCNDLNDFQDTAALIEVMDIVVSIDTSVAHLAASMGKPTWILLPFAADFRWLLATETSPWYPTVKLYRQSRINSWDDALDRVKLGLENAANTR